MRLSQLDVKRQARKETKASPAVAVACPVCGHICASEFGLWSHHMRYSCPRRFATENYDDDDVDDDDDDDVCVCVCACVRMRASVCVCVRA